MNTYRELKIWTLHIVYRSNLGIAFGGLDIVGFATEKQAKKYAEENYRGEDWSVSCQSLKDFAEKQQKEYKSWYYEERERNNKLREEIDARAEKLAEEKFKQLMKNKSKEIAKVIERTLKS